ncbi:GOLPH3/VPS74 family protein [Rubinisphaera italica]|uniref:Golgi phosphoprotein 3 (GPP34) n=1 Tax=Rubinisphaera italica TaxID=2527969 RepID=A0A5C5XM35_9PLAN|nr:GPP34 family phosphoprotein [Rubinisphaera italica]TWT64266.1 hypothetical protein Pan54_50280 [Rubinisphaera italica]
MTESKPLHLYEELLLLALHDEKGTLNGGYIEHALAGAVLAELLLEDQIIIDDQANGLIKLQMDKEPDDPLFRKAYRLINLWQKPMSLEGLLSELANLSSLRYLATEQLCDRGVVENVEETILYIFSRNIYPTLNPAPEQEIVSRIRDGIFNDEAQLDPRTCALISLAHHTDYITAAISFHERAKHKARIEVIAKEELAGSATQKAIAACQAAVTASILMTTIMMSQVNT